MLQKRKILRERLVLKRRWLLEGGTTEIMSKIKDQRSKLKRRSGQTLIIVMVIMVISLSVGLAVSTRATSSLRRVTQTYQSAQALSFAESGLETALAVADLSTHMGDHDMGDIDEDGVATDCSYTVSLAGSTGNFVSFLNRDLVQQVNLVAGSGSGTVYWSADSEEDAAMVITLLYLDGTDYKIIKYAVDPNASRRVNNGFAVPSIGSSSYDGVTYSYGQTFATPVGKTPVALRIRSMYNTGAISFWVSAANLPGQGYRITSTGKKGSSIRKAEVSVGQPAAPSMFDYVLFSGGNLQK